MQRQNNINTYACEFARVAFASIHDEILLEDINRCIQIYEDGILTKQQLNKVYKNDMKQMNYEIKIRQMKVESDYFQEVYKRLYNNVECVPIVESNDITSEEPTINTVMSQNIMMLYINMLNLKKNLKN